MIAIASSKTKKVDWTDGMVSAVGRMIYAGCIRAHDKIVAARTWSEGHLRRTARGASSDALESASRWRAVRQDELEHALEEWDNEGGSLPLAPTVRSSATMLVGYPRYFNDIGVREIRIGATEFHCIGALPPQDHPHIYLNMEGKPQILCPYCSTRYIYDERLRPDETEPAKCFYNPEMDGLMKPLNGRRS